MTKESIWTLDSLKDHFDSLRVEDLRARSLTEARINDRFEEHNRFREQINHERANYVTRDQLDALKESMVANKEATDKALLLREGQTRGMNQIWQFVLSVVLASGTLVAIAVAFLK